MQKVGIIGLGIMGGAIARNLLDDGAEVIGYDVETAPCEALQRAGGTRASSPMDVANHSDILFTSLPSAQALDQVVNGSEGISKAKASGQVVVELSTFRIEEKEKARQELEKIGIFLLDTPVSGTGKQAITRDISLYVSGDEESYKKAKPVIARFSRSCHYVGEFGNGSRMKFVANLLVAVHNVAAAEALVLGMKSGLEPNAILKVIGDGAGTSRMFEVRGPVMVEQTYDDAGMKMDVWQKDLAIIGEFANQLQTATPLFDASVDIYKTTLNAGYTKQDTAVVCRTLEDLANLKR